MEVLRNIKLKDCKIYYKNLSKFVKERKYFTVCISDGNKISKKEKKLIYQNVLNPLVNISNDVLFYDLAENTNQFESCSKYLEKKRNQYSLKNKQNGMEPLDKLLYRSSGYVGELRGSLLIETVFSKVNWKTLFGFVYDPIIFNNINPVCTSSSVKKAKKQRDTSYVYVNLSNVNLGLQWLTLFASEKNIGKLLDIASKEAMITEHLYLNYGPESNIEKVDT